MSDFAGKRILIIILSGGIGDVLLSTVVLKPLKEYYPDSSITMMIKTGMEELIDDNEYVTEILSVKDGNLKGKNFDEWLDKIKERHFDIAIVLWSRPEEAYLIYRAGIPVRVGQSSRIFYSFLYTNKVSVRTEKGDTVTHWTDIMLDYVRALDIPVSKAEVIFRFPTDDLFYDMKMLLNHYAGDKKGPFFFFFFCKGLKTDIEKWPVAYFAKLGDTIVEELGGTVVLTGSASEVPIVEKVSSLMNKPNINFAGKTNINELAALITCLRGFIAPDTGTGHISAVLGVPTVSIFALKSDFPNRWKPFGPKVAFVVPKSYICNQKKCIKEKCPRFTCYNGIDPKYVVSKLAGLCSMLKDSSVYDLH